MTQKERQERSRNKILQAAMQAYGSRNYEDVSMEKLCADYGISKGMMYHYYANKDELFLLCIQEVFSQLKQYIEQHASALQGQAVLPRIRDFFLIREDFFQQHPLEKNVFEIAMFRAPKHLKEDIQALRKPLRELNQAFLRSVVLELSLRSSLQKEEVARYLECMDELFWEILRRYRPKDAALDLHSFSRYAEPLLDMILFGIVQQEPAPDQP